MGLHEILGRQFRCKMSGIGPHSTLAGHRTDSVIQYVAELLCERKIGPAVVEDAPNVTVELVLAFCETPISVVAERVRRRSCAGEQGARPDEAIASAIYYRLP